MIDLDQYVKDVEEALQKLFLDWRPRLMERHGEGKFDLKADKTVVTDLDKSLELAIKNVIRPLSSEVGFWGEEHGQEGSKDIFWFVDPIDGTELYIRGMNGCRTLLCLIMNDEPVYVFAYRFVTKELFTAQKGKGTFKNGKQVHISNRPLSRAWVEMSVDMNKPEAIASMVHVFNAVESVVYTKDFLQVLEGFIDAHVMINGKGGLWDYAPRALLMSEAGANICNLGSHTYNYKNMSLVAAHPEIFDDLNKLLSLEA